MKKAVLGYLLVGSYITIIVAGGGHSKPAAVTIAPAEELRMRIKKVCILQDPNCEPEEVVLLFEKLRFFDIFAGKTFDIHQLSNQLDHMIKQSGQALLYEDDDDVDNILVRVLRWYVSRSVSHEFAQNKPLYYEILLNDDYPHVLYQIPEYQKYINQTNI